MAAVAVATATVVAATAEVKVAGLAEAAKVVGLVVAVRAVEMGEAGMVAVAEAVMAVGTGVVMGEAMVEEKAVVTAVARGG